MTDRAVYLVPRLTKAMSGHALEFVDDEGLNALLACGWQTGTTLERTVMVAGKSVKAVMLVLRRASDSRAVSLLPDDDQDTGSRHDHSVIVQDEFGQGRRIPIVQAVVEGIRGMARGIANLGEHPGHLGAPKNHNMVGVSIISGELIHKAFDLGLTAAMRGEPASANPFPANSGPAQRWLQGWNRKADTMDQKIDRVALEEAEVLGETTARSLGRHDEAHCPYHGALKQAWLRGFKRGGGTIER